MLLQNFVSKLFLKKWSVFGGDFEKFERQESGDEIYGCDVITCTQEEWAVKKVE